MNPAPNLVMVGPMGAGKSCIGRRLAERFGLDFVDVDQVIVEQAGSSIPDIFEQHGEAHFRQLEADTLQTLLQQHNKLISTGGGAVLDARNRQCIREGGFVVYLHVSVPAQLARLARDRNRPLLQRADRAQALHTMAAQRTPLYQQVADLTLETDHFSPAEATAQLVLRLAAQWRMSSPPA
ncbi:shikimate kinase [Xanthomonas melonis]|uniref:Shikimate kinase n=1 Tax=Xanthomonas melonis TaxID=56456 RepID=A0A2S7DF89_9XANT|nr:shikimate kinase [Xanthomonas melonis]MCC4599355.1 shikimate kinase [Xanthomonas melonis]MCD0247575.1 shikimate kinase [Xanthomonas melonis]MCD0279070.1 shikimate kinase [Xanthomonas melonis]PPU72483.1 shikimate kinase [Xanthomonas melonis]